MIHYIIDGNNLIGRVAVLSNLQNKDKHAAREQLVYILSNYFSGKKVKITLHFDGFENIKINFSAGRIVYSGNKTADDKIKEQISSAKSRKNLIVVSSDNEIRNYAKACGCILLSIEEFNKLVYSKDPVNDEEKRIKEMNDIEEFKRLFNVKK